MSGQTLIAIIEKRNLNTYQDEFNKQNKTLTGSIIVRGKTNEGIVKNIHADSVVSLQKGQDPEEIARAGDAYIVLHDAIQLTTNDSSKPELTELAMTFAKRNPDALGIVGKTPEQAAQKFADEAKLPTKTRPAYQRNK